MKEAKALNAYKRMMRGEHVPDYEMWDEHNGMYGRRTVVMYKGECVARVVRNPNGLISVTRL